MIRNKLKNLAVVGAAFFALEAAAVDFSGKTI